MEKYLNKLYKEVKINRYITNKSLFKNYNIVGKTTEFSNYYRNELKIKGLL
jgi:ribosomal protein S25